MLHILRHSPYHADLDTLLCCISPGDDLLLIQDGVLAAIAGTAQLERLLSAPISLNVLQADLDARGLSAQISPGIERVSYTDFVRLAVKNPQQMTW